MKHTARLKKKKIIEDVGGGALWAEMVIEITDDETGEVHEYRHRHNLDTGTDDQQELQKLLDERKDFYLRRHEKRKKVKGFLEELT